MAKSALEYPGQPATSLGGIDESASLTEVSFAHTNGSFPFFAGMHERMFGKKIIEFNKDSAGAGGAFQQIYGIQQVFNGICLYGYYVQTNRKLYYHVCNAPPDLRIKFWPNV